MSHVFSSYLRALAAGETRANSEFPDLWRALRRALRRELVRRGLWESSPSLLGIYGAPSWQTPAAAEPEAGVSSAGTTLGAMPRDALDELATDAYLFIFVTRLRSLRAQLRLKPNVDGLVYRNVRNFIHDTQKRCDPLGFRVYKMLRAALEQLLAEGRLVFLVGGPKIDNDAVFADAPTVAPAAAEGVVLDDLVRAWNDDLLPELMTACGVESAAVVARLAEAIAALPASGVEAFRFGDLIEPLRADVRARWGALWGEGDVGFEEAGATEGWREVVRLIEPDTGVEDRDQFDKLDRCVEARLTELAVQERSREHLRKLWRFLRDHAEGGDARAAAASASPAEAAAGEQLPSRRELAKLLGIPRDRFPDLFATLGELIERCREQLAPAPSGGGQRSAGAAGNTRLERRGMSEDELRHELVRRSLAELERLGRDEDGDGGAPRPGDLFALPRTAAFDVEWLVLEDDGRGGFFTVPADTDPLAGRGDFAVDGGAALGPLTVRLGDGLWLAAADFAGAPRGGTVPASTLERLREHRRQLAAGLPPTAAEEESDDDPELRERRRELAEARAALAPVARIAPVTPLARPEASRRRRTVPRWGAFGHPAAVAASILFVLTLGVLGGRTYETRRIGEELVHVRRELGAEVETLRNAYEEAQVQRRKEQERSEEERAAAEARHREEVERLRDQLAGVGEPTPIFDAPLGLLYGGNTRGDPDTVVVGPDQEWIVLILALPATNAGDRIEIRPRDGGAPLWSERLAAGSATAGEKVILVPSHLLPPGDYRIRLLRGGDEVTQYSLRVTLP